jgi:hypothetical protein
MAESISSRARTRRFCSHCNCHVSKSTWYNHLNLRIDSNEGGNSPKDKVRQPLVCTRSVVPASSALKNYYAIPFSLLTPWAAAGYILCRLGLVLSLFLILHSNHLRKNSSLVTMTAQKVMSTQWVVTTRCFKIWSGSAVKLMKVQQPKIQ